MKKHEFFIKDFCCIKSETGIDLSFLPVLLRRKLSRLDKFALASMEKIYSDDIEEIVFSSKTGEIGRLDKIIEQYQSFDEVSPAQFSASVHNYAAGFFTLFKKLNTPYYAISAGEDSFKSGLIKSVLSKKDNVMFTYADDFSMSCIVSKTGGKIRLDLDEITDFETFLGALGE